MNSTILFVDDEKNVLSSLERYLVREEFEKVFCTSALQALEVLEKKPVQVVVSDIRMPEMNGLEFLRQVREKYPETVRMVLSGTSETNLVIEAINNGEVFRYLTKPLAEVKELKSILRQALEFYELRAKKAELLEELACKNSELSAWKERMAYELKVAEKLQKKLLDAFPQNTKSFLTRFAYQPCWSIGGDFYDSIILPNDRLCVYLGDVSGHGVGSALISTLLKMTTTDLVRDYFQDGPAAICRRLNEYMNTHVLQTDCFATMFLAIFDPAEMSWHACNCGHPVPLVFSRNGAAKLDSLSTHGTLPLGFFDDPKRYTKEYQISWSCDAGDTLFLFTDGLFEARDKTGEQFGMENLAQIVSEKISNTESLPVPQEIIDEVAARGFDCGADDCCAIFVRT